MDGWVDGGMDGLGRKKRKNEQRRCGLVGIMRLGLCLG